MTYSQHKDHSSSHYKSLIIKFCCYISQYTGISKIGKSNEGLNLPKPNANTVHLVMVIYQMSMLGLVKRLTLLLFLCDIVSIINAEHGVVVVTGTKLVRIL